MSNCFQNIRYKRKEKYKFCKQTTNLLSCSVATFMHLKKMILFIYSHFLDLINSTPLPPTGKICQTNGTRLKSATGVIHSSLPVDRDSRCFAHLTHVNHFHLKKMTLQLRYRKQKLTAGDQLEPSILDPSQLNEKARKVTAQMVLEKR